MYPVERYLHTVKGYVRNKTHPEGSITEGYILEECLTFFSRFLDMDTKDNCVNQREIVTMNEPPSDLSIFLKWITIGEVRRSTKFHQMSFGR
jgi:hypothetical protein